MPAIWDRILFYSCALVSGLAAIVLVASLTSPLPAAASRQQRSPIQTVDSWCNPAACTSVGKTVANSRLPRYD